MGRKRQKLSPGKTKKKLKLSTPDTTSHQSNLNFNCNKEVVIQIERLSESVVAEMTVGWSALPPEQTKKKLKLSTPKTKLHPSNPHFICDKEVVVQLDRLSDSFVAEMTAGGPALPLEQQVKEERAHDKINFETEKCKLESKIDKYKEQCTELRCKNEKLQNENDELQSENENIQNENKRLQKCLQDLESSNINVVEKSQINLYNTDLNSQITKVIAELEQVKEERARDKINFETEKCDLESKIDKYKEQCTELQSEKEELQSEKEELQSEKEELQSENEKLQSENEKLRNENEKLRNENKKLQSENEKLQSENKRLQKYSQDLESSNINVEEKSQMNLYNTDLNRQITKVNETNYDALDINAMPNEILLKVFSYLTQNQLGQIARVCRRWNVLTKSPLLWRKVHVKIFSSDTEENAVTKSFINGLPPCVSFIRLDFAEFDFSEWEDLISIDFEELCAKLHQKCPHLEELIFACCAITNILPEVINFCTQFLQCVKKLEFHYCRFSNLSRTVELNDNSKIEVLDLCCCDVKHFNRTQFSKLLYLKELRLSATNVDDTWFEDDASFFNQLEVLDLGRTLITARTFRAIQNYSHNLKELYLCNLNLQAHDLNFNKSVFPQLKTICLSCYHITCESVVSLIQSCPSLQNVYVSKHVARSFAAHPFVLANRCKSEIVKVIRPVHIHDIDYLHT